METNNNKTTATVTHLSALSQYFIPFGNFIFPIVIWSSTKKNSEFVDHHGRQAINFQLSILLYSLILFLIAAPIVLTTIFKNVPFSAIIDGNDVTIENFSAANITGMVTVAVVAIVFFFFVKVAEFFLIINAAVMAANGKYYNYPLTINFIKQLVEETPVTNQPPIEPIQP